MQRDWARGLAAFGFLGFATIALTWPIAVSLDESFATHADYFSNIWNFWWVRKSLFELGTSPYWTDFLFFPDGISLAAAADQRRETRSRQAEIFGSFMFAVLSW